MYTRLKHFHDISGIYYSPFLTEGWYSNGRGFKDGRDHELDLIEEISETKEPKMEFMTDYRRSWTS